MSEFFSNRAINVSLVLEILWQGDLRAMTRPIPNDSKKRLFLSHRLFNELNGFVDNELGTLAFEDFGGCPVL